MSTPERLAPDAGTVACPLCSGPMERVPRHLGDRLLSLFRPRWRYRCVSHVCGWEGCLRPPPAGGASARYAAGHEAAPARPEVAAERPPASAR